MDGDGTFQAWNVKEQFGIAISYGRLQRYYHRWQQAEEIKAQSGVNISVNELVAIQNGENISLAPIAQHLILKSACIQAGSGENNPAQLLTLQRIANNQFNQEMAKAKNELEQRRQNLRAKEIELKQPDPKASNVIPLPANPAPAPSSTESTQSTTSAPSRTTASVQNPQLFEQPIHSAGPYIREYPEISSFAKGGPLDEPAARSAIS